MPDPERLMNTLRRAIAAFRATPGRTGRFVEIQHGTEVLIAGDLHGNVENMARLLKAANLAEHPGRHLILQEVIHGPFHYPNGTDKSHQLLDLLAALKCQFSTQVHFLLGNHELAQWAGRRIGKGDETYNVSFCEGVHTAYGERARAIYNLYMEMIGTAPLAIRTRNRVFISHSTPEARHFEQFHFPALLRDELLAEDLVTGGTAYAMVWGRDTRESTVKAFLELVDADLVINGHIPCENGYEVLNPYQLILDAMGTPACYCLFPLEKQMQMEELVAGVRVL